MFITILISANSLYLATHTYSACSEQPCSRIRHALDTRVFGMFQTQVFSMLRIYGQQCSEQPFTMLWTFIHNAEDTYSACSGQPFTMLWTFIHNAEDRHSSWFGRIFSMLRTAIHHTEYIHSPCSEHTFTLLRTHIQYAQDTHSDTYSPWSGHTHHAQDTHSPCPKHTLTMLEASIDLEFLLKHFVTSKCTLYFV